MRVLPLLLLCALYAPAHAQSMTPRIGFGLSGTMTTDSDNPFGLGIHVRGSLPVNPDLSFAAGAGFTGFVLGGREDASYYATPHLVAIITLNSLNPRSPYVVFGGGGYLPVGGKEENRDGGPLLQGGMGWATSLQQTSIYLEVTPSLVIGKNASRIVMPVKVGVVL